ncbi:MAG TPA: LamG-like jellyroll fold domain-containing protein [Verrucomicrobiae bacterium]|nr:LamG-like jellyroll fold domain-containing protein [Verrucomicrobiae bacterium]
MAVPGSDRSPANAASVASASSSNAPSTTANPGPTAATFASPTPNTNIISPQRQWDATFLTRHAGARVGDVIQFELTNGKQASGVLESIKFQNDGVVYVDGVMTSPTPGRFFIQDLAWRGLGSGLVGVITLSEPSASYRIEQAEDGSMTLLELPRDLVVCVNYAPAPTNQTEEIPPLNPSDAADYPVPAYQDGIISLQSLPGAPGVLYMDFRGGRTDGEGWGTFDFEKPNVSNAQIKDVWKRVAEDFLPFTINVTTDIKVYESAPANSRIRCALTPTTTAAPGAGGVAYINSWGGGGLCWAFYSSGKSAAEVVSHEVGHTLGLGHDGRITPDEGYFGGHGSGSTGWAPIMGVGYYQPVVQWSKGEYTSANNLQNDLAIITSKTGAGYRVDDTGNSLATARYLEAYTGNTVGQEGVIERTADTDAFQFTTTGGTVSLQARPVNGEWADLAISATLVNSSGTVIASNNPQTQLNAAITTAVAAGTYTFNITGAGRNNPASSGFSDYASLGYYSITGTVAGVRLPSRFIVDESSPNGTIVGTITNNGIDFFSCAIVSGNFNGAFALDNNGVLTVANSAALNYESLASNTVFAVQYELFVNITNETTPALTELNRRVVIRVRDVNEPPVLTSTTNYVLTGTPAGTAIAPVNAVDPDFFTVLSYSITAGNSTGIFTVGTNDGVLRIANPPTPAQAGTYNLTIRAADTTATPTNASVTVLIHVITNNAPFAPHGIAYAVYDGIGSGNLVSDLTSNARFPRDANWEKIQTRFDSDRNRAASYGSVMRGYLIPPLSGNYTFYIASDDNSALLLSASTNPAAAVQIAAVSGSGNWTDPYQWTKYAIQRSTPRALVAGQAYYIEARHKEGDGGDHLSVAWVGPHTGGQTNVIEGVYLAPAYLNYVPRVTGFAANVRRDAITGLRIGRLAVTDANTSETATCSIISGNGEGIFAVDSAGWISVANGAALASTPTTVFTLPIRVTDNGTPALSSTGTVSLTVIAPTNLPSQLRREIFAGINGSNVSDLTNNAKYPSRPDSLEVLSSFSSAVNTADNYGSRIRGLLVPPASGLYRFWIASDDGGVLRLSTTSSPQGAATIAYIADGNWSDPGQWTKYASQMSALRSLVAGQRYYIETLHKEGGGGDAVQVAWSGPGLPAGTNIIAGTYLEAVDLNFPPVVSGFTTIIAPGTANGAVLGSITASDGPLDSAAFQIASGNVGNTFAIQPTTGVITVNDNSLLTNNATFHVLVLVQDSGLGGLYPLKTNYAVAHIGVLSPGEVVQGLKHRYSFVTNTADSVGGADAVLQGAAVVSGGRLQVPGGAARVNCAALNLASTFATNASLSFEAWCTVTTHQDWAKVWMFGQPGAETSLAYVDFTPRASGGLPSMSFNSVSGTELNSRAAPNPAAMIAGAEYHIIGVYDAAANQMRLYTNGVLADTASLGGGNMTQIPATEGYLGAAVNFGDPNLNGNINEFRVWNVPLSGLQVALNKAAGPDAVLSAAAAQATYLTAATTNPNPGQIIQVQVSSDFNVVNLPTTAYATNWMSSNPAVATVNASGFVTAVANGFTTISATVAGATGTLGFWVGPIPPELGSQPQSLSRVVGESAEFAVSATGSALKYQWSKNGIVVPGATNTTLSLTNVTFADSADYSVTVSNNVTFVTSSNAHLTVLAPELLHRWSFTDGTDSVGGAHATLVGAAHYTGGRLQIPGGAARVNCATVNLTSTLATNGSLSIEGWFTMNTLQNWSKVWMFGRANGGLENGLAYVDFTPLPGADGGVPSMSFNSGLMGNEVNTRGGANPALLSIGPEYHVVAVYDAAADQMRLYIDGALADTASLGGGNIMQLNANEAYFGAAVNYPDPNLNGAINEIRIWRTPLNATLVASQFAAGPDNLVNYSPVVTLNISLIGGVPTITWPFGVLEEADSLKGPWTSLVEATSPYTPAAAALQKFYRVKVN